jgi:hypothetical protein
MSQSTEICCKTKCVYLIFFCNSSKHCITSCSEIFFLYCYTRRYTNKKTNIHIQRFNITFSIIFLRFGYKSPRALFRIKKESYRDRCFILFKQYNMGQKKRRGEELYLDTCYDDAHRGTFRKFNVCTFCCSPELIFYQTN